MEIKTELTNQLSKNLRIAAGILSIAAGAVHGFAVGEHWAEWWGYGTFFLLASMGQVVYGLLLFGQPWLYDPRGHIRADGERYARIVYLLGVWVNVAIIVLYIVTRTVGIPFFGPEAGDVEAVTPLGAISKALEIALIGVLSLLIRRR